MYVKLHETEDRRLRSVSSNLDPSLVTCRSRCRCIGNEATVVARDLWLLTIFGEDKLHLDWNRSGKDRPAMPVSFSSGISQSERVYITRIDQRSPKNNQGRGVALATSTSWLLWFQESYDQTYQKCFLNSTLYLPGLSLPVQLGRQSYVGQHGSASSPDPVQGASTKRQWVEHHASDTPVSLSSRQAVSFSGLDEGRGPVTEAIGSLTTPWLE